MMLGELVLCSTSQNVLMMFHGTPSLIPFFLIWAILSRRLFFINSCGHWKMENVVQYFVWAAATWALAYPSDMHLHMHRWEPVVHELACLSLLCPPNFFRVDFTDAQYTDSNSMSVHPYFSLQ